VKFFVPHAKDDAQAEQVYESIRRFVGAPPQKRPIWKLVWEHAQQDMECEIGKPMPAYYRTGDDPVLAIFDTGVLYMICTIRRGGKSGGPILAGCNESPSRTYFSEDEAA
jgi:hypothetical protein